MSISKQDKQLSNALKGLSGKERREAEAAAREKRRNRIYIAAAAVAAVLIAALLFWDSGVLQRGVVAMTVGEEKYSTVAVEYYFYSAYNNVYPYASYYGIDTSTSLKEQKAYEDTTWYDYLMENARSTMVSVAILKQEGQAAGYKMSDEGKANVAKAMDELQEQADSYGISVSSLLSQMYGRYMTKGYYRSLIEDSCYASDYASSKAESFEITDEEIETYYTENADKLDSYDFDCYLVNGLPETKKDEDGKTITATDEEKAAALEAASQLANQLKDAFAAGDDAAAAQIVEENELTSYSGISPSSFSSYVFGEWLTSADRQAGDTTIEELTSGSTTTGYYVLCFHSRTRDDYHGLNVYNLQVNAEAITNDEGDSSSSAKSETTYDMEAALKAITGYQDSWIDSGKTAEAFEKLAKEHSVSSNASSGGLTENAHKGSMDTLINDWLFGDETRSPGDYTILEDADRHRYQLVFVASEQEQYYWQTQAVSSLRSTKYSDWYKEVSESYETKDTEDFPDFDI